MSSETQIDVKLARVGGALSGALNEHAGDSGNQLAVRTDNIGVEIGTDNYIHQVRAAVIVPGTTPFVGGSGLVSATDTHTLFADYPVGLFPLTLTYFADVRPFTFFPGYTSALGTPFNVPFQYGVMYRDLLSGMYGEPTNIVTAPPVTDLHGGYRISYTPSWLPDGYIDAFISQTREISGDVAASGFNPTWLTFGAGSYSAESSGGGAPQNAFDGDDSTVWGSTTTGPGPWLRVDLNNAGPLPIQGTRIYQPNFPTQYMTGYDIQGSNDGTTWTTIASGAPTAAEDLLTFISPATYKSFRVLCTAEDPGYGTAIGSFNLYVEPHQVGTGDNYSAFYLQLAPFPIPQQNVGDPYNSYYIVARGRSSYGQQGQAWSYSGSMQVGAPHLVASNVNLPSILGGDVTLTLPGLGTATTDKKQGHCRVYVTPHGVPDQQLPILLDTLSDGAAGASARLSISRDWTNPFSIDMTDFLTATSGQADVYVFSDVVPYNYDIKVYHG